MKKYRKYSKEFRQVSEKLHWFYFNQGNSKKKLDGDVNESKCNKNKW